MYSEYHR
jgi:hypothetical protein